MSWYNGYVARLTKLDDCCGPIASACMTIVFDGFTSINSTPRTNEIAAVQVQNARGRYCVDVEAITENVGRTLTIAFCGPNFRGIEMTTGQELWLENGVVKGISEGVVESTDRYALEVWSQVFEGKNLCVNGAQKSWGYYLWPCLSLGSLGDLNIQAGGIEWTVANSQTSPGNTWGKGLYPVILDADGDPSLLLNDLPTDKHFLAFETKLPPPAPSDCTNTGPTPVGATAGTPGGFTPVGAFAPYSFAGLASVTATPATPWTTGQSVLLADGTHAYWDGDSWNSGIAS